MNNKIMHKYSVIITCLISIIFFHSTKILSRESSEIQTPKSFIWEVKSDKTTVYILGSIHVAKPSLYPLSEPIENAFDKTSKLVLEINPLTVDNSRVQEMIVQDGLYPEGDSIKNHINPEVLEMLVNYLKNEHMTVEMVQNMKPGLLAITLSMYQMTSLGYTAEYGIDNYFVRKSKGKKEIHELETIEDQINLLLNMPDGNLLLRYTLMEIQNIENYLEQISETWKKGDSKGLYEFILEPYENDARLKPILDKLFFERNEKMASKIKSYLDTDDKYFIVVGAGHLVGDRGIINILRNANYEIKQL